jgi:hypothetical protein
MTESPLGLFIQPACLQHKYIRHPNASHIFERPERLRAVLLGVAAAVSRLEEAEETFTKSLPKSEADDLSSMLSGLSIQSSFTSPRHLSIVDPPRPKTAGQVLLHHPALQLAHSPPSSALVDGGPIPSSSYLKNLHKWASEALETIKSTGCEIPSGLGLNQGDLYLGPGSILAIEGAVRFLLILLYKVLMSRSKRSARRLTRSATTYQARRFGRHRQLHLIIPNQKVRDSTKHSAQSDLRGITVERTCLLGTSRLSS